MTVTFVEADPGAGFHYPYFLHVPDAFEGDQRRPILVEPTCSAGPSDEFEDHLETAERRAEGGFGRRVADELDVPFLHPVFPRPRTEPVDWLHYVHALDAETMRIEDGPLERVDRQLLRMVEDARERLVDRGYPTCERFSLNGFSASGTFANRFAALHPQRVLSVSAGGLNGMAVLPVETAGNRTRLASAFEELEDRPLPYPVGVADVEELTGSPFDRGAFRDVDQFLYMGGADEKDALLWPDAWTEADLRLSALLAYGEDVHEERFPNCEAVYDDVGAPAVFRVYEGAGHTPEPAQADVVEFHRRSFAGDDVEAIRADLGGNVPTVPGGRGPE